MKKPPLEFVDALNEAFRLEDVAVQAGIRWGAVPAGEDAQELADMNEAGEALRAHATEVYDAITAHKRVEGRTPCERSRIDLVPKIMATDPTQDLDVYTAI